MSALRYDGRAAERIARDFKMLIAIIAPDGVGLGTVNDDLIGAEVDASQVAADLGEARAQNAKLLDAHRRDVDVLGRIDALAARLKKADVERTRLLTQRSRTPTLLPTLSTDAIERG